MHATPTKRLLNENEAADFLSITVRSVRGDRYRGGLGIPYVKIGSCVRYDVLDLEAFLTERKHVVLAERKRAPAKV